MCIYIYIERERKRDTCVQRERGINIYIGPCRCPQAGGQWPAGRACCAWRGSLFVITALLHVLSSLILISMLIVLLLVVVL